MIYCLLGQAGAGKDAVMKELIKKGYKRIVSHTTRPMRPGEKEGVNYYFHKSTNEAKNEFNLKTYHSALGDWCYWFEWDDIKKAAESDDVFLTIADVTGSRKLEELGAKLIYVYAPTHIRMERYYDRESKSDNPNYKEVLRRLIQDSKDFDTFDHEARELYKYKTIYNTSSLNAAIIEADIYISEEDSRNG